MLGWNSFRTESPELAEAAARLFKLNDVAFLATASATGSARLHPFVPRVVEVRLVAFIVDRSPKYTDLLRAPAVRHPSDAGA